MIRLVIYFLHTFKFRIDVKTVNWVRPNSKLKAYKKNSSNDLLISSKECTMMINMITNRCYRL